MWWQGWWYDLTTTVASGSYKREYFGGILYPRPCQPLHLGTGCLQSIQFHASCRPNSQMPMRHEWMTTSARQSKGENNTKHIIIIYIWNQTTDRSTAVVTDLPSTIYRWPSRVLGKVSHSCSGTDSVTEPGSGLQVVSTPESMNHQWIFIQPRNDLIQRLTKEYYCLD